MMKIIIIFFALLAAGGFGQSAGMPEPSLLRDTPAAILLTGGYNDYDYYLSTVELFPPSSACGPLPPLDTKRWGHITFTHQGQIVTCGGANDDFLDTCERLDLASNSWVHHSQLTSQNRRGSSYAVIQEEPCLIGGAGIGADYDASKTLECYSEGSWQTLPESIPEGGVWRSCSARTPGGGVLIVGGGWPPWDGEHSQVLERFSSGTWDTSSWPQLPQGRQGHSCSTYNNDQKLMVTGGVGDDTYGVTSTLIIDLDTKVISGGPDMINHRAYHATLTLGGKVYVLGGIYYDWHYPFYVEVFDEASGVWREMGETLTEVKSEMGSSLVTLSSIGC